MKPFISCLAISLTVLAMFSCSNHQNQATEEGLKKSVMNWIEKNGMNPERMHILQLKYRDTASLYSFDITARITQDNGTDTVKEVRNNVSTDDFKLLKFDGLSVGMWEYYLRKASDAR